MIKIKNPWYNKHSIVSKEYFSFFESDIKFTYKNGMILEIAKNDYLHTVNNKAACELAGINKELLKQIVDGNGNKNDFLYNRALQNLKKDKIK